jgi:long-chain acyl-CoA synthetase
LRRQGLHPGDRVLRALPNGPLFVATLTAILACEGSPLVVHSKTPAAELQRYAQRFGARFLACESGEEPGLAEIELAADEITLGNIASLHWGTLFITDEACTGPTLRGVPLHPTSGSTGLPKIALRPGFAAMEEARHYAMTMSIDESDSIVAIPPMSHAYGYGMCVMVPLLTGANIISMHKFSVKLVARAVAEHPATILPTVPAMLDVLSFGAGLDLRSLRWVLAAGAMLPRRAAEQFRVKTGAIACPLYGTTETGGISVATAADGGDVDGRVGPSMDGVEIEIRPYADSEVLGPNIGKVFVRSSSMMTGYIDDRGAIQSPIADGWFETGDLGQLAPDGAIHLRGRNSEVINVSGLKVVPCEVEEAILTLPAVREARVYAGEHRSGTQIVKAAVAGEAGLTAADIRSHCELNLVYYKRPQIITLVDALPRTPTGKIIRDQLP